MLSRSTLTFVTLLAVGSGACVINNNPDGAGGSGGGTTASNGTGGGTGGDATSAGGGGTGGATNGSGGGGGGPTCTDPAGSTPAVLVTACDDTNVASITMCPDTTVPLANPTCSRSFELYTSGAWEDLLACIETIPATIPEACDEPAATNNVAACVDTMYANACPNTAMDANCDSIQAQCDAVPQTGYDTADCKADLAPFSDDGYAEYVACFNDPNVTEPCDTIHAFCMDRILTLP